MKKETLTRIVNREPHRDQIEAAYLLIERMKGGTEARNKAIVAEVWRTMFDNMPMGRRTGLTKHQRMILEIIAEHIAEKGVSPTYAEIGAHMGWSRMKAHEICRQLARRKIISMGGGWRELRIIKHPDTV